MGADKLCRRYPCGRTHQQEKGCGIFEKDILCKLPTGNISALQALNKYLFDGIYDFAGELRTVNISRDNFHFATLVYLQATLENIGKMTQPAFGKIIEKCVGMNIAHPFLDGNGRSTRLWLDRILKNEISKAVDRSKIDNEDYLPAMARSTIKGI